MMMENKELMGKLVDYYMTSDKESLALAVAGLQLDIVRFMAFDALPKEEQKCLVERSTSLMEQTDSFIKGGARAPLKCMRLNSAEDWQEKFSEGES